ncbi:unnamed protein product, partial [Cyprideis torosa]
MSNFGVSSSALAQAEGGEQVDLVTQSQNPIASMISVPFDFTSYQNVGEDNKTQNVILFKPVVPIDITENWNFVLRALIPFIDKPDSGPIDGKAGVGDIGLQSYFVPKKTNSLGRDNFWTWGVGPVLQFDTASDDILGTGRNAAGIGGVFFSKINNWTVGALLNNVWDVDSSNTRDGVNLMTSQPFVNYNLDNGWYLKTDPVITYNQKADSGNKWTVPVGGGFGRVFNWGKQPLSLKNAIPSHDTFGDAFAAIDTEQFSQCFIRWVSDLATLSEGQIIAIAGKTVRRSLDKALKKAAIHVKVDDKSNEITAISKLLERLDIAGAVVTIDAMGCQKKIARQIIEQKGDYGDLLDDVKTYFTSDKSPNLSVVEIDAETRKAVVSGDLDWLKQSHPEWEGLRSVLAVTAERCFKDKIEQETRYFITSLDDSDPQRLAHAVRAHWSVENNLHWVLDVAFDEDSNRTRTGNSAANLAVVRHIAV